VSRANTYERDLRGWMGRAFSFLLSLPIPSSMASELTPMTMEMMLVACGQPTASAPAAVPDQLLAPAIHSTQPHAIPVPTRSHVSYPDVLD
jgi:hypothetical protein